MKLILSLATIAIITAGSALADPVNMTCVGKIKGKPVTYEVMISNDRETITYVSRGKTATNKVVTHYSHIDLEYKTLNWETMKFYDKSSDNFVEAFVGHIDDEGLMIWESKDGRVEDSCVLAD